MRNAIARPLVTSVLMCLVASLVASPCRAQSASATTLDDAENNKGLHGERGDFSPEPSEHFDTMSANVVLTLTDLVLPGNAGAHSAFNGPTTISRLTARIRRDGCQRLASRWCYASQLVFTHNNPGLGFTEIWRQGRSIAE